MPKPEKAGRQGGPSCFYLTHEIRAMIDRVADVAGVPRSRIVENALVKAFSLDPEAAVLGGEKEKPERANAQATG